MRRREIENYLWDPAVLRTFLTANNCDDTIAQEILNEWESMISGDIGKAKVKDNVGKIFQIIRNKSGLHKLGNNYKDFAEYNLVDALRKTESVYAQLHDDIFDPLKTI